MSIFFYHSSTKYETFIRMMYDPLEIFYFATQNSWLKRIIESWTALNKQ